MNASHTSNPPPSVMADRLGVMKAAENGEQIQYRVIGYKAWHTATHGVSWDWDRFEYRAKPPSTNPKYLF